MNRDLAPTIPRNKPRTASGFPVGNIKDAYGQMYECKPSGQIVRKGGPKLTKTQKKQFKKKLRDIRNKHQKG